MSNVVDLEKWTKDHKPVKRDPSKPHIFESRFGEWVLAVDNPATVIIAGSREECIALWMKSRCENG
jgi:hypothetical protein